MVITFDSFTPNPLKGTLTEKYLMQAFAKEAQDCLRYQFYANQAREEGYEKIAVILEITAHHEKEHAKRIYNSMEGGQCEVNAEFIAGKVRKTDENLRMAIVGEHREWKRDYPCYATIAEQEGFPEIASMFWNLAEKEHEHEQCFLEQLQYLEGDKITKEKGNEEAKMKRSH